MVYLGPPEDLDPENGFAKEFVAFTIIDTYIIYGNRAGFHYNDDPECAKSMQLDPEKKHVVMAHGTA